MKTESRIVIHKMVTVALLSALAYVVMFVGRVPLVSFLKYDPKDVIIMIGGLAYGPGVTIAISVIVSFFEFITVSSDGIIGFFMNVLSTLSFVTLATIIYRRGFTVKHLLIGLIAGTALTTFVMVAWNYIVTPWFLQIPRSEVILMLVPVIIPFNLIKSSINSIIIVLMYQPIVKTLKLTKNKLETKSDFKFVVMFIIISLLSIMIFMSLVNNI